MKFVDLPREYYLAIEAANKVFIEKGFDLTKYRYLVGDAGDHYSVTILTKAVAPEYKNYRGDPNGLDIEGNPGDAPAYEVSLDKTDFKVLKQHFVR